MTSNSSTVYAVGYATKGTTYIWEAKDSAAPTLARYSEDPGDPFGKKGKSGFLEMITPGDTVLMELGGAGDRMAIATYGLGAKVLCYPSFELGPESVASLLSGEGIDLPDERARGKETSADLTARKARARALLVLSRTNPDRFVELDEQRLSTLQLKIAWHAYWSLKQAVMASAKSLLSAYRDAALLSLTKARQRAAGLSGDDLHSEVVKQIMIDLLGGDPDQDERQKFFALIGSKFPEGLPRILTERNVEAIIDIVLNHDDFRSTTIDRLKVMEKRIVKLLEGGKMGRKKDAEIITPNQIWQQVLKPIPAMGPLTAARILAAAGDIRTSKAPPNLRAFAGYHHFEDGSRARRRSGHVSNWNMLIKQAVWLWCQGTIKLPSSPWRRMLDCRRAYELLKLLREREAAAQEAGHDYVLVPEAFRVRKVTSVLDVNPTDLQVLIEHIDALRGQAGSRHDSKESVVIDRDLGRLLAGIKKRALEKACRWLGQKLLTFIWVKWNLAVDAPIPERHRHLVSWAENVERGRWANGHRAGSREAAA